MKKTIFTVLSIAILFGSCTKDKPLTTNLTIDFTQSVGVYSPIILDSMIYANDLWQQYSIETIKYLVSDITLHKDDSTLVYLKEVHYVDVTDATTLCVDLGELENGNYTSISFTMGLDTAKNKSNNYINEDFHATMDWPAVMGGGYHYMKLEGAFVNDSSKYNVHTGGSMGGDYSFSNSFDASVISDSEHGDATITIDMNIGGWLHNYPLSTAGIMMNEEVQSQLQSYGKSGVFSVSVNQ